MSKQTDYIKRLRTLDDARKTQDDMRALGGTSFAEIGQSLRDREIYRIGLWPLRSEQHTSALLGAWSLFATLLEEHPAVRLHRLFFAFGKDVAEEDLAWSVEQSQFDAEDWSPDDLRENAAIFGEFDADSMVLRIDVENDVIDTEDSIERSFVDIDIPQLHQAVLDVLQELYDRLDLVKVGESEQGVTLRALKALDREALQSVEISAMAETMETVFEVETLLAYGLYNEQFDTSEIRQCIQLLIADIDTHGPTGAWILGATLMHLSRPGYQAVHRVIRELDELIEEVGELPVFFHEMLAVALERSGASTDAYRYLFERANQSPDSEYLWYTLQSMYLRNQRLPEAIETGQQALQQEHTTKRILYDYARGLYLSTIYHELPKALYFGSAAVMQPEDLLEECITALGIAIEQDADDLRLRELRAMVLIAMQSENDTLWDDFAFLFAKDADGLRTRAVIDELWQLETIEPAVERAQDIADQTTLSFEQLLNYAILYLSAEREIEALQVLHEAASLAQTVQDREIVAQLIVQAEDPEFEMLYAELVAALDTGREPISSAVEYLEGIVERTPNFIEARITLARAYLSWKDLDVASEILLDILEELPQHSPALRLLATVFWQSGEQDLALEYLNRAIQIDPLDVLAITQTARYLFVEDEHDLARTYLARAEEIDPEHPALEATRRYIARRI